MADVSPVAFRDEESLPLLGAVTLEILGLGIDPVNRRLIPVDALLLPSRRESAGWSNAEEGYRGALPAATLLT